LQWFTPASAENMTKAEPRPRRLLRLRDAAQYLSLSPWKLRHIIQSGQLPIIKYGENAPWLLDLRDLDGWIERNKHIIE
jgi:excisionase family DNA binding protein